jgi:hypothetical protein
MRTEYLPQAAVNEEAAMVRPYHLAQQRDYVQCARSVFEESLQSIAQPD